MLCQICKNYAFCTNCVMKARATHCTHERSFKHVDVVGCSGDKLLPRDHVLQLRRSVRAKTSRLRCSVEQLLHTQCVKTIVNHTLKGINYPTPFSLVCRRTSSLQQLDFKRPIRAIIGLAPDRSLFLSLMFCF